MKVNMRCSLFNIHEALFRQGSGAKNVRIEADSETGCGIIIG